MYATPRMRSYWHNAFPLQIGGRGAESLEKSQKQQKRNQQHAYNVVTTRISNPRHLKLSSTGRLEKMATSVVILAQMDPIQARSDVLGRSKGLLKRPAAVLKRPASAAICNASQWPVVAPRVEDAIRRGQQGISAYIPKLLALRTDDVELDDSWVWMGCPLSH